jgi:MFS family permease
MMLFDRLQEWYYTPPAQAALLGIVFLLNFAAYLTIQAFAERTYGDVLASNTTVALYSTFTVSCFFSPSIVLRMGPRRAMAVGIIGYAVLVVASLAYFVWEIPDYVVVIAGAINGLGSALLWNSQGVLILQYSDRGSNGGTLFSIFWAFFNMSAIIGGIISFWYFQKNQGNSDYTVLYIVFLGFIIAGAFCTRFLLPPSLLRRETSPEPFVEVPDASSRQHLLIDQPSYSSITNDEPAKSESWTKEGLETLALFRTRRMLIVSVLFFYTGFKQPYQIVTFGNRYFNDATLSLEVMMFYFVNMLGGIWIGRVVDGSCWFCGSHLVKQHRVVAIRCLWVSVIFTTIGNACAVAQEWKCRNAVHDELCVVALDYMALVPSIAYACWGFTDATVQTYCYWLLGLYYESQEEQSRAIGFYICVQSFGWALGFWFIPASRMKPITQLAWTVVTYFVGTILCLWELPPRPKLRPSSDKGKEVTF